MLGIRTSDTVITQRMKKKKPPHWAVKGDLPGCVESPPFRAGKESANPLAPKGVDIIDTLFIFIQTANRLTRVRQFQHFAHVFCDKIRGFMFSP